jgi:hypothetical protein
MIDQYVCMGTIQVERLVFQVAEFVRIPPNSKISRLPLQVLKLVLAPQAEG